MKTKISTADAGVVVLLPAGVGRWVRIRKMGRGQHVGDIRSKRGYQSKHIKFGDGKGLPLAVRYKQWRQLAERMRGE